jgi:hypothetical protein
VTGNTRQDLLCLIPDTFIKTFTFRNNQLTFDEEQILHPVKCKLINVKVRASLNVAVVANNLMECDDLYWMRE